MKRRQLGEREKHRLIANLREALKIRDDIRFAYIFGSFVTEEAFRDIDLAVYLQDSDRKQAPPLEIDLERSLEDRLGYPIDVRVINHAPLPFRYHVLKDGILLIDRVPDLRTDYERWTWKAYFDYKHIRDEYLRGTACDSV